MCKYKRDIRGITLLELVITIMFILILTGVTVFVYRSVLLSWSFQDERGGLGVLLDRGMERMARDLREAKTIYDERVGYSEEVRFKAVDDTEYIYYLYNANDTVPPAFDQDSYDLKRAAWSGFSQGDGVVVLRGVLPPPTTDFDPDTAGNRVIMDFTVSQDDESVRSKTVIYPRNL